MKPGALSVVYNVFSPLPSAGSGGQKMRRLVECQLLLPGRGRLTESIPGIIFIKWRTAEGSPPRTRHQDIKPITSMEKEKKREKVIVVGAGPVGSLAALYAANRGNDVEV